MKAGGNHHFFKFAFLGRTKALFVQMRQMRHAIDFSDICWFVSDRNGINTVTTIGAAAIVVLGTSSSNRPVVECWCSAIDSVTALCVALLRAARSARLCACVQVAGTSVSVCVRCLLTTLVQHYVGCVSVRNKKKKETKKM